MNLDKWNSLTPDQQAVLNTEIAALTERMWVETATEDEVAISCITGGKCDIGKPGKMTLVEPTEADMSIRDQVANDVILARWAKRCGEECAATWK